MEWEDYYNPRDFYGEASFKAKNFCKKHPEADKQLVYCAAQDAATAYEISENLRRKPFKLIVYISIMTAVYNAKRKENIMNLETKEAMIRDYESGMSSKDIAERYHPNLKTTENNLRNWEKKGVLKLRKIKKEPATDTAVTSTNENTFIYHRDMIGKVVTSVSEAVQNATPVQQTYLKIVMAMAIAIPSVTAATKGLALAKTAYNAALTLLIPKQITFASALKATMGWIGLIAGAITCLVSCIETDSYALTDELLSRWLFLRAPPAAEEARRKWRSGRNFAKRTASEKISGTASGSMRCHYLMVFFRVFFTELVFLLFLVCFRVFYAHMNSPFYGVLYRLCIEIGAVAWYNEENTNRN